MKDSIGNELPKGIMLTSANSDLLGKALAVNSFLMACGSAMRAGKYVVYDKASQSATITDKKGFTTFINH